MKPLFNLPPLTAEKPENPKGEIVAAAGKKFHSLVNTGNKNIADVFPQFISPEHHYHWVSLGGWSMYHFVAYVLNTTGPAHLAFSTWAISEQSARSLVLWKDQGKLLSIDGILDVRARTRHEAAYHLISGHCRQLVLAHCHAKVTVLHNAKWCITILGSANFTENPRIEAGVLCAQPEVGQFHLQWIKNAIQSKL